MPDRLYNVIHEPQSAMYQVLSDRLNYFIMFPDGRSNFQDIITGNSIKFVNIYDNVNIINEFGNQLIDTKIIIIDNNKNEFNFTFQFDNDIALVKESDSLIAVKQDEIGIASLIIHNVVDEIGGSGLLPTINIDDLGRGQWTISLTIPEVWLNDSSRIYPLIAQFTMSFSPLSMDNGIMMASVSASSTDAVYRDTRPYSATQFSVLFFDDSQFRRLKPNYDGMAVCSTVPYAIGDTYNLTAADIQQWYDGVGNQSREVYLQIIASKLIPSTTAVYFDVIFPGSIDLYSQQASYVDSLGGLPIYKGVFTINKQQSPAYVDGTGYLNVYLIEAKTKDIEGKLSVLGYRRSLLDGEIVVEIDPGAIIHYGIRALMGEIDVHALGRAALTGTITVVPEAGGIGFGLKILGGVITVYNPDTTEYWYNTNNKIINKTQRLKNAMAPASGIYNDGITSQSFYGDNIYMTRFCNFIRNSNGQVYGWGMGRYLGEGSYLNQSITSPVIVAGNLSFSQISAHYQYAAGVNSAGSIWTWGYNNTRGVLGTATEYHSTPVSITGSTSYSQIQATNSMLIARAYNGSIHYCGQKFGRLAAQNSLIAESEFTGHSFVKVTGGDLYIAGLKQNGEVYVAGDFQSHATVSFSPATLASGVHSFIDISGGTHHILAVKDNGELWSIGDNNHGELGIGGAIEYLTFQQVPISDSVASIGAGYHMSMVVGNQIWTWGMPPEEMTGLTLNQKYAHLGRGFESNLDTNLVYSSPVKIAGYYTSSGQFSVGINLPRNALWGKLNSVTNPESDQLLIWGMDIVNSSLLDPMLLEDGYLGNAQPGNKSEPSQVIINDNDQWGGYISRDITNISAGSRQPRLFTYGNTSDSISEVYCPYSDLMTVAQSMNNMPSSGSTYWTWDSAEDDSYFPYLHMSMTSTNTSFDKFRQRSYFIGKNFDFTTGVKFRFTFNNRGFTPVITPFDLYYQNLYGGSILFYEQYQTLQPRIRVVIDLLDYDGSTVEIFRANKTSTTSTYNTLNTINFNILDFNNLHGGIRPSPVGGSTPGGETYPMRVWITLSPLMYGWSDIWSPTYNDYNFIAPVAEPVITNITINPL